MDEPRIQNRRGADMTLQEEAQAFRDLADKFPTNKQIKDELHISGADMTYLTSTEGYFLNKEEMQVLRRVQSETNDTELSDLIRDLDVTGRMRISVAGWEWLDEFSKE